MAIAGLRATDSFDSDARPLNWRAGVLWRYPNGMTPLTGLTSLISKRMVDDPEYNWWEQAFTEQRVALGADIDDGTSDTDLTLVANPAGKEEGGGLQLFPGHILRSEETGELMLVTAVTSDTAITVVREFAGSTGVAITYNAAGVNPNLHVVGNAFEEASDAPPAVMYDPVKVRNYTHIFRNTLEASRTALQTRLRTVDLATEAKRQTAELHAIEMEKAFWWSLAYEGSLNGKPHRTMDGVLARVHADNIIDGVTDSAGAGPTLEEFENWMELCFRYGSSEKMAFCGNGAVLTLQRIIRFARGAQFELMQGQKEFGMNVMRFVCPFGTLVLKTHPLFNQLLPGITGGSAYTSMSHSMVVLDMEQLKYVYLKGSDTQYERELQANGIDGVKSGYITECSIETHHPKCHMIFNNLSTFASEAAAPAAE